MDVGGSDQPRPESIFTGAAGGGAVACVGAVYDGVGGACMCWGVYV